MNHWTEQEKAVFRAFLKLQTEEEVANFCRDLMTLAEIKEFSKRWQIASLLYFKKMSYEEIARQVKTSTTTVTRVNQWLNYGMNGYKTVLKRMRNNKLQISNQ